MIHSKQELNSLGLFYDPKTKVLIRVLKSGKQKEIKRYLYKDGYIRYPVSIKGKVEHIGQHHLEWFYANPDQEIPQDGTRYVIDHIDECKTNNEPSNLQRITQSQNILKHHQIKPYKREKKVKPTWLQTDEVREKAKVTRKKTKIKKLEQQLKGLKGEIE